MARVFTIKFPFQGENYEAFVEYRSTPEELFYHVRVNDPSIEKLLPKNRLRYSGVNGYKELAIHNPLTEKLVAAIATAIEAHLVNVIRE